MEELSDVMNKESIMKVHKTFFKDINFNEFEAKILKLEYEKRRRFIDACLFLEESENIKTEIPVIKYLLLFTSVETLMGETHKTFEQWLTSDNEIKGKKERDNTISDIKIQNRDKFKKLSEIYHNYYGVTESVRKFFSEYIELEDKKKLIRSLSVENKDMRKFFHKCYISDCICYREHNTQECYPSAKFGCVLKLNNKEHIEEALRRTISIFYVLFRNEPSHSGVRSNTVNNSETLITSYDSKTVKIRISFDELRRIIVKGLNNFYMKEIANYDER